MRKIILLAIASLLLNGCGYFNSGTWEDDPESWNKVFGGDTPKEVKVIHSRFWKSAHWSYEYEVFFELKTNVRFFKSFFLSNDYFKVNKIKKENYDDLLGPFEDKPNWFIPKQLEDYIIWTNDRGTVKIYLDKKKYTVFYHALQL